MISATKYIMRKESTRDHVDLLLSSRHWPLVYAVDMACDIVAHMEVRSPSLATALWSDKRGCFEKPKLGRSPKVCFRRHCPYYTNHAGPLLDNLYRSLAYQSSRKFILFPFQGYAKYSRSTTIPTVWYTQLHKQLITM